LADSTVSFELDTCTRPWETSTGPVEVPVGDAALLEGLRKGDDYAYQTLITRFQQPVYNLIYRLLNDPSEAGDVVQEVFLKVFRSVGSFRGQSSLKTWIYRIAMNEAHNHRRWFGRRRSLEIGLEDDQGDGKTYEQVLSDQSRSPFDITLDHETMHCIEAALSSLKPAFRVAVVLRDIEGLSYDEIAEVLQISLGTVKSRILRGREALREQLAGSLVADSVPSSNLSPAPGAIR
jgi:RNA polymerase sigma-70 factor (ECF subfamily)